jgi:hypothetical protein
MTLFSPKPHHNNRQINSGAYSSAGYLPSHYHNILPFLTFLTLYIATSQMAGTLSTHFWCECAGRERERKWRTVWLYRTHGKRPDGGTSKSRFHSAATGEKMRAFNRVIHQPWKYIEWAYNMVVRERLERKIKYRKKKTAGWPKQYVIKVSGNKTPLQLLHSPCAAVQFSSQVEIFFFVYINIYRNSYYSYY